MRSFTLETAALLLLAAIALILLTLIGHVRAEPLTTRSNGFDRRLEYPNFGIV
jgi:hypothetical protein